MLPSVLFFLAGCSSNDITLGSFDLSVDDKAGQLVVYRAGKPIYDLRQLALGAGTADIQFQVGSYLFDDIQESWAPIDSFKVQTARDDTLLLANLRAADGEDLATLEVWTPGEDILALRVTPFQGAQVSGADINRIRTRVGCDEAGPFLGAGGHQLDVDHQGEAFSLWTSEPGIGKVETDDPPDDWFLTGTRHATSFPSPFLLRPELPVGVGLDTQARVDLDLCASDPGIYELSAWDHNLGIYVVGGDSALDVVELNSLVTGGVKLPPDEAFGPWNDAIRGTERVLELANTLRDAGAPTSLMWTEDWKGAEETAFGYHLSYEWTLDEELYPDAESTADELRALGFGWLAYFSPFVGTDGQAFEETSADDLLMMTEDGEPYLFTSATFEDISALDLSDASAQAWAQDRMQEVLDIGFVGWMTDFAEWVPPDAVLDGIDPVMDHNAMPLLWQQTNADLLYELDATWFVRSGWTGTQALAPVVWGGDQQTDWSTDDGFPTVLPLGLGLSTSGVPFFGSDIGGYSTVGTENSTKELWFRWAWLGAFSPIMRTHHGAWDLENWAPDRDEETLEHWVRTATEHARLFPYLRGLAALAETQGRPLLLHPGLVYEGYDWDRMDAWLLGQALFVAPVVEEGAVGREVELPPGDWYDWWTGQPASSGWQDADVDEIPVFVASGSIVPMLAEAPDTFLSDADDALVDLDEADETRTIRVFGTGGSFEEEDGTLYQATGNATAAGSETVEQFWAGEVEVNGLTLSIEGTTPRTYTVEVVP